MKIWMTLVPILAAAVASAAAPRELPVVVYGATPCGLSAAIQSRRMGKTAVLIEPSKHVGGMTSGGLGATDIGNKGAIGGFAREFYRRIRKHYDDDANWNWQKRSEFKG